MLPGLSLAAGAVVVDVGAGDVVVGGGVVVDDGGGVVDVARAAGVVVLTDGVADGDAVGLDVCVGVDDVVAGRLAVAVGVVCRACL